MSTDETASEDNAHAYETEESFHPMGAEWEDQMREELEETDFDAELGMQMARDAQRLVAGELSEEEFYAEYHDDVSEEFDVDDRPVLDDLDVEDPGALADSDIEDESVLSSLADIDLEADEASRRDVMKKMGAGAAFLAYGAYATHDSQSDPVPQDISGITPADEDERDHRWGMVIDLERCDGCLACVSGCVDENATSTGANWMYVFPYQNEDAGQQNFLVRPCQHCSNAPCAKVCPVRARHTRSKDGLVLTDYETCIGCRYCQVACPYGVNYFQWGEPDVPMKEDGEKVIDHLEKTPGEVRDLDFEERKQQLSDVNDHVYDERGRWVDSRPPQGVMGKCTMCPSRQDEHTENPKGTVACMDACDEQGMSAIHFGDLDDPDSRANRYLRRRSDTQFETDTKFDAALSFDINDEEPIDADPGSYPLYFINRRLDRDEQPWRLLDSRHVVVAEGERFEESQSFARSSIADLGGVPGEETSLLDPGETTSIEVTLVFDDDEFEDATERDVEISLELVGADRETVATDTVTLDEEADAVNGRIEQAATLTADGVGVPVDEVYGLFLLVAEDDTRRAADHQRVLVSTSGNLERPDPPYNASGLDGALEEMPDVLFTDEPATATAGVAYPNRPQNHEKRLVLDSDDVTIDTVDDTGDTIAELEYEFTQTMTTNTAWGKLSSFRLLEELGTEPNITYLGNEPGPEDEQTEGPVGYDDIRTSKWGDWMEIKDNRKEHLDYGAGARDRVGGD